MYPVHTAERPYIHPLPPMVGYPNIEIISASQHHRITFLQLSLLISFITHSLIACFFSLFVCLFFFHCSFFPCCCPRLVACAMPCPQYCHCLAPQPRCSLPYCMWHAVHLAHYPTSIALSSSRIITSYIAMS